MIRFLKTTKPLISVPLLVTGVAVFCSSMADLALAQPRALSVRPALRHNLVGSEVAPIMRSSEIREAEMAFTRQSEQTTETETVRIADHAAKALGHILEQTTRAPQSGVVLVAKHGFDAQKLLWDLKARRINSRIFADRIAWLGYADQRGCFVVPEVPRGVSLSGVVIATHFRPAPFVMHVRRGDAETMEIAPIYLSR